VLFPFLSTDPLDTRKGIVRGNYTLQPITIQAGDRFVAVLGCEFNNPGCSILFTLQYDDGSGTYAYVTSQAKTYDGTLLALNIDLSSLAGKTVTFRLQIDAIAVSAQNRVILVNPLIIR
jgi:hypothetical protein